MQKHLDIIPHRKAEKKARLNKTQRLMLAGVGMVVVAAVAVLAFFHHANSSTAYIKTSDYQALFLTNSQVYFGKLQRLNDSSYRMTDVYYLKSEGGQTAANSTEQKANDPTQQATQTPTLVKLGDELHGPQDEVIIRDNQVLFWENLKVDGKVSKAIAEYKKKGN